MDENDETEEGYWQENTKSGDGKYIKQIKKYSCSILAILKPRHGQAQQVIGDDRRNSESWGEEAV